MVEAQRTQEEEREGEAAPCRAGAILAAGVAKPSLPDLEHAFTIENIAHAACLCKRGVAWKGQVQAFHMNLLYNCMKLQEEVLDGSYRPKPGRVFSIHERGKPRTVTACCFRDRVVQRVLCNQVLVPAVQSVAVEGNSACLPGRGTSYAMLLLERHLHEHWRNHGLRGGILLADFSKYFANIDPSLSLAQFQQLVEDRRILELLRCIFALSDLGLDLGSQASQVAAVLFPSPVDNWAVREYGVRGYGRYMDDSYALFDDWKQMVDFSREFEERCSELGIVMNPRKFRFVKVGEEFTFLKTRFQLQGNGSVVRRLPAAAFRRRRQRLKRLQQLVKMGALEQEVLERSEIAWQSVVRSRMGSMALKMSDGSAYCGCRSRH